MEYKLTKKKLQTLFCNTVEIFFKELEDRGINIEKPVSTTLLAQILYESPQFSTWEKCDGFYITYRNALFNEEFISKEMYDKFYALAGLQNCGKWILDSHNLNGCDWVIKGENLENCFHCKDCEKSRNLLYCMSMEGMDNKYNYYAFNAPVSSSRWEELRGMGHDELMRQPEYIASFDFNMINLNFK